ncbi:hypothetical protein BD289DRAFT_430284 [Coniella lustricola]|uniref:Rhomboid family membrane protein n=1 Tax=Coniella lustricola TaxID=2025994 RepID=A0A2T3AC84_9PEZI|nr:hypothetical protein BD289DRAFT_430284 [Coniella lustricola]
MASPRAQPPSGQPSPSSQPPTQPAGPTTASYVRSPDWMHYSAWAGVILGPIALIMPPRRMGLQAVVLATGTSYATNILAYDYTGESIYQRFNRRWYNMVDGGLPEKARITQERMRVAREQREAGLSEEQRRVLQEEREKKEMAQRSLWQRLWMGNEKSNWREERARQDKEALEEGKGYGDIIVEQVKEVFGSSEHKKDNASKTDEKPNDDKKQ